MQFVFADMLDLFVLGLIERKKVMAVKKIKHTIIFDITDNVAIVTGCSTGLGVQMAHALANEG